MQDCLEGPSRRVTWLRREERQGVLAGERPQPDERRWRRRQRPGRGDWVAAQSKERLQTDGARHRRDDWIAAERQEWLGRGRTEPLKQDCRECP